MDAGARIAERGGASLERLTVAFSAGLLAALAAPAPFPLYWPVALALLSSCLSLHPRLRPFRLPALAAIAGAAWVSVSTASTLAGYWPAERHGEDVWITGQLSGLPERRPARASAFGGLAVDEAEEHHDWRFMFVPDAAARATGVPGRIRVNWYERAGSLHAGECWRLHLRMRSPRGSVSPGAFDFEAWLFRERVGATAWVREGLPCGAGRRMALHAMRDRLRAALAERLDGHPSERWVQALVLGDRGGLDDDDWRVFQITGTGHLMVISGMQVGLVAGVVLFMVRLLWARSTWLTSRLAATRAGLVAGGLTALIYAALAGFAVPTRRALLMWAALALAWWSGRISRSWTVLALAWLLVLLHDPFAPLAASAWLSFGAVAGILWILAGRAGGAPWWWSGAKLQFGLLLVLSPLTLLYFDGLAWPSPFVNALAIPIYGLMLPALMAAVALSLVWPTVGTPLLSLAAHAFGLLREGLGHAADLPGAWWPHAAGLLPVCMALLGAALLLLPRGLPFWLPGLLLWLPALWPVKGGPEGLRMAVLDVGQGLAVVVQTQKHALVFDAGPAWPGGFDAGDSVVAPWLRRQGVRELDMLVLSHLHLDHYGGMEALREAFVVREERATGRGPPCLAGERWRWDGVEFEFLHPASPARWSVNNVSCVLRISLGPTAILLTGDIEQGAERALLGQGREALAAEILVAPHHGSATSSQPAFVFAVDPALVLYGAGWRNQYRHPRPEVVARYRRRGAVQAYTGGAGTLVVEVSPDGDWRLRQWRERSRRLWRMPMEAPEEMP